MTLYYDLKYEIGPDQNCQKWVQGEMEVWISTEAACVVIDRLTN